MAGITKGLDVSGGVYTDDNFYGKDARPFIPPGMSFEWSGYKYDETRSIPIGYLEEDGSAVSRTTYAALFYVLGTTYGAGDGSTTFNLPNSKGRVMVGRDTSQTEFDVTGETGGDKNMQQHNHLTNIYNNGSGTSWKYYAPVNSGACGTEISPQNSGTGNSGNLQPYIVKRKIIKY
jgi:hypothetical protein